VAYREGETVTGPEEFARAVQARLQREARPLGLSIERRFIVRRGRARGTCRRPTPYGQRIITTDAMTTSSAWRCNEAYHPIVPVLQCQASGEPAVGPVCESATIWDASTPPEMKRRLGSQRSQARGAVMSPNYNGRPRRRFSGR
jgi:hypothetical protein